MAKRFSLLKSLRELATDEFLKADIPEEVLNILRERGYITTYIGRGPDLTDKGWDTLKKLEGKQS
jgi:DNA-binding transcriptional regulator YhcF (GntR family)